jgi:arylsulfatase A-like enzyme
MNRCLKSALFLIGALCAASSAKTAQPNVVLIVCDDLNDYITGIPGQSGHPQARTPNVEKLAKSGVAFRRAYSNNPVCAPSRSSFLTGLYPHTSKNLFWDDWAKNPVQKNSKTLMEHFRDNGYHTAGSGKLMHHFHGNVWEEFKYRADYGPFVHNGEKTIAHPSVPKPFSDMDGAMVDGSFASLDDVPFADDDNPMSGWVYSENWVSKPMRYVSEDDRDPTPDERNAQWAAERIQTYAAEKNNEPLFLAVGFIRPHTPLHVPQKYFDQFPIEDVELPIIKPGDAEDCHYKEVFDAEVKGLKYFRLLNESYPEKDAGVRAFTQAYLASVAAVDECIGQVVDAVDNSPLKDNTIIVLTSDHGWNMGEKDFLFKNSLWEESTRIPFVVRAPGVAKPGAVAEHPISLIDLYPTLIDLCGLKGDTRKNEKGARLDGFSVRPFLENPKNGKWDGPDGALTMVNADENAIVDLPDEDYNNPEKQHWSLRTRRWRYIRYNNGMEELYDHGNDPHEWTNLADNPEFEQQKKLLGQQLLKQTHPKESQP